MRRIPLATLLTASIVVLVLLFYALTFEVRFSEVAVKVRLGEVVDTPQEPGLYRRWPWPIETVKKYDRRLRTLDTVEGEIKTQDGKNVIVATYAIWRIADPELFYIRVGTESRAEQQLRTRIIQRRAAVIGNETLSAFVNLNKELVDANYDRIEDALLSGKLVDTSGEARSLKESVRDDFGIHLEKVAIRRISLPQDTTRSVFEQMIAERQKEAARFREEGAARAATITAQAGAARDQILAFANTKATEISAKGIQASKRILEQIAAEDVEFFEWLRWLDALRVSLRQKTTVFLDSNSSLFEPFVKPLMVDDE